MSVMKTYGGCWPTPGQELLLRACLMPGVEAAEAFRKWKAASDINTVDPGSYRLFPLLYANLRSNGVEDPLMNIFRWVYDKTLSNNGTLYGRLAALLKELNARDMPAVLVKGSALALIYYADAGLRPATPEGVVYNPLRDAWSLSSDTDVNYMLAAVKPGASPGMVADAR